MEMYSMNQPNFRTISQQELKDYFLTHRDDQEAFYVYIDKLHEEENWIEMPPLKSVEDLNNYSEFTKQCYDDSSRDC